MADQSLSYAVRLDSSAFQRGMREATKSLSAFRIGLANALVSKGFSLLQQAVSRFSAAFRSSLDLGSELTHLSAETGASVSELLTLRRAFDDCGVSAASLPSALSLMQRALSGVSETGQRTEDAFAALGLDIRDLRKMPAARAFETIGTAIGSLGSAADRAAAATAIFGRSGSSLNRVFSNPRAIRDARDALGSMPAIMTNLAGTAESYQTALSRIQTQIQGALMGALSGILPVLDEISQKTASIDFGEIGLNIGAYLKQVWEGGLTGLFYDLAARCNIIGVAVWEAIKMAFAPLFRGDTWKSLGLLVGGALLEAAGMLSKAFTACVAILTAGILRAVDYLKEGLNYIPGLDFETSGKSFGQRYDDAMQGLGFTYQPALDMANDLVQRGMSGVADAWSGAFDGWGEAVQNSAGAQYLAAMKQEREAWKDLFLQRASLTERKEQMAATEAAATAAESPTDPAKKAASPTDHPSADRWTRIGAFAGNGTQAQALNIQRGSFMVLKSLLTATNRIGNSVRHPSVLTL